MKISHPENLRTVDDYDITFTSGQIMTFTVDKVMGDVIRFEPEGVVIELKAKPSAADPTSLLPAEEITLYLRHIICVQHRSREVRDLTPDERVERAKIFQDFTKAVH